MESLIKKAEYKRKPVRSGVQYYFQIPVTLINAKVINKKEKYTIIILQEKKEE